MEKNIRVLLVDDDLDFRSALADRLRIRNYDISEAADGPSAIATMKHQEIDVIVLDLRMPGMDGLEVLRLIKEVNPLVEVVLLTGYASLESGIEGMRLGAFDYLIKPCKIEELDSMIQKAHRRGAALPHES